MRAAGLRIGAVRLHLHGMDEVGKLDRVLDEEHRDIVADEVPIALAGVELHRKAAHVARRVDRSGPASDGREADEHFGLLALGEDGGSGEVRDVVGRLEHAVRARSAGVNDPLGDPLVIEVEDLFAKDEILQQRRPARAGLQAVLIVTDRHAMVGRQACRITGRPLMRLAAVAGRSLELAHVDFLGRQRGARGQRSEGAKGLIPMRI